MKIWGPLIIWLLIGFATYFFYGIQHSTESPKIKARIARDRQEREDERRRLSDSFKSGHVQTKRNSSSSRSVRGNSPSKNSDSYTGNRFQNQNYQTQNFSGSSQRQSGSQNKRAQTREFQDSAPVRASFSQKATSSSPDKGKSRAPRIKNKELVRTDTDNTYFNAHAAYSERMNSTYNKSVRHQRSVDSSPTKMRRSTSNKSFSSGYNSTSYRNSPTKMLNNKDYTLIPGTTEFAEAQQYNNQLQSSILEEFENCDQYDNDSDQEPVYKPAPIYGVGMHKQQNLASITNRKKHPGTRVY